MASSPVSLHKQHLAKQAEENLAARKYADERFTNPAQRRIRGAARLAFLAGVLWQKGQQNG